MEIWQIGDVTITRVVELLTPTPLEALFPDATPKLLGPDRNWLEPHFLDRDGNMLLSIHAFAIRSGDARIVVDTCLGNGKLRALPEWSNLETCFLDHLAAAGFAPESVDRVLCTHLHFDHVGWNTRRHDGRWVPTFPRARYLIGAKEWEYWEHEVDPLAPEAKADSIWPLFEAGLVDLVPPELAITDEVRLIPTPGHTPGHVSVWIRSHGAEAVITGDTFHHPLQMAHPEWRDIADADAIQAHQTRVEFCTQFGDRPVLVLGTHFASPTGGHIVREGTAFRFEA